MTCFTPGRFLLLAAESEGQTAPGTASTFNSLNASPVPGGNGRVAFAALTFDAARATPASHSTDSAARSSTPQANWRSSPP